MKLKRLGSVLFLAALMLLAGCKGKEDATESSVPPSIISATPVPQAPQEEKVKAAVVSGVEAGLNVRAQASTDSSILGEVQNGAKLKLLKEEKEGDFYQVSYQGKTGYVYAEYVKVEEVARSQLTDAASTPAPENTVSETGNSGTEDLEHSEAASTVSESAQAAPTPSPAPKIITRHDGEA